MESYSAYLCKDDFTLQTWSRQETYMFLNPRKSGYFRRRARKKGEEWKVDFFSSLAIELTPNCQKSIPTLPGKRMNYFSWNATTTAGQFLRNTYVQTQKTHLSPKMSLKIPWGRVFSLFLKQPKMDFKSLFYRIPLGYSNRWVSDMKGTRSPSLLFCEGHPLSKAWFSWTKTTNIQLSSTSWECLLSSGDDRFWFSTEVSDC